ncbi:cytochrome b5 [Rhodotorula sp. JG-1b]|nr:cytochrome b5 [Rhodotorula sp. JG-1b]
MAASPTRSASAAASSRRRSAPPAAKQRKPSALAQLAKWILLALVTNVALSRALTQSWTWGYDGKWIKPRTYREFVRPFAPVVLSEAQLALHDGTRPDRYPLYLAFDGDVYDISDGGMRNYGPGGAYHQFAGRDAARAFVTGCFKTHLTHDLRGLTQDQLAIVSNWKNFYRNHAKYRHIGTVVHPPIDPSSPIPPPCNDAKAQPGGGK